MGKRLSGLNPLSYLGVEPLSPPLTIEVDRAPRNTDNEYNLGTFWIQKNTQAIYVLLSVKRGQAIWIQIDSGGAGATIFNADVGAASPVMGSLNVFGDTSSVLTTGVNNTITVTLLSSFTDEYICNTGTAIPVAGTLNIVGGNQFATLGAGNTIETNLTNGLNGQILIGGGANPTWANITSSGGSITITDGPNSINLETAVAPGSQSYIADVGTATPAAGVIQILGGSNINTAGAGSTITTNLDNTVSISGSWDTGTITDIGTGLTVLAGGITSTGTTTLTDLNAGVMQTNASGIVSSTSGTDGQVLIGGGSAPTWNNITSTDGSITITNGPNTINLESASSVAGDPFLACQASNFTSSLSSEYYLGSSVALTEIFDVGGNFSPGNGAGTSAKYTAPATGRYFFAFNVQLFVNSFSVTTLFVIILRIRTNNRVYTKQDQWNSFISTALSRADRGNWFEVIADMSAGHIAEFTVQVTVTSGVASFNVVGSGTSTLNTFISGYRIA